jgi:hypothetical protein
MLEHGQCSEGGEEIVLWSRNETLDEEFKQETYEVAFWVCLQPEMVDIPNKNCKFNLNFIKNMTYHELKSIKVCL